MLFFDIGSKLTVNNLFLSGSLTVLMVFLDNLARNLPTLNISYLPCDFMKILIFLLNLFDLQEEENWCYGNKQVGKYVSKIQLARNEGKVS
jgi:hypothetical protein